MKDDGYVRMDVEGSALRPRRRRGPGRRSLALLAAALVLFTIGFVVVSPSLEQAPAEDGIHLTTWPKVIEDGGDLVVFWPETARVNKNDYLTLSCGPQQGTDDYLARKNVTEFDATLNSVRFSELFMMRCDYSVEYFRYHKGKKSYESLTKIQVGMRESFNTPKHGHLALTTQENAMAVMYNSASSRTPEARYGTDPTNLDHHATGTSTTYKASDMCQAPATTVAQRLFRDPGFMHTAIMTDLTPETTYFYQYGNDVDGWSKVAQFRSRPKKDTKTTKFIAYADMGVDTAPAAQSNAVRVYSDVVGDGFDSFLLHFGDISYARGEGSVWDKFFHIIEPYATRVPYMVSVGNHEHDYTAGGEHDPSGEAGSAGNGFHPHWGNYGEDSLGECSVPMYHRWHVPATGNSLFWYSFDYGGIHVVQMSSEHNFTRGSNQYEWLERDLASVNRIESPWIVLTAHRMMYSTQKDIDVDIHLGERFRAEVEPLLMKYRVNLVLVGHQHSYERSCPVYQGECVRDGKSAPVHFVVGSAGFGLSDNGFTSKYGNWSLVHADEYGHLRVATTATQMHIEFISNRNGIVYDEVTLEPY
ncbi:hypothetical protein Poli38472_000218 [Pythium oligandrum]|uniref:Purple acid phosphatase n=1 Tax=Pythium oligandrum TaxID=41045 RepID=A0A8K1CC15_PYTOL|nr:hypothetical protein Poli38472_000218 [Pythium oligandrum]|eukprot:TMW60176.1 hypothetical protein Poli38472_000218 [Pythium oligandrum]